ncbi:MAG: dipeptidyl carboxypeptidase II, partial [Shewanella sp.]
MRKSVIATAVAAVLLLGGCAKTAVVDSGQAQGSTQAQESQVNVLLSKSPLQDQAPQFNLIRAEDYAVGFAEGINAHSAEIAGIINNPEKASFDNTILALETSGALLTRVSRTFFSLAGLISDETFLKIEADIAPKLADHEDNIYLDSQLFGRVAEVYQHKSRLDPQDQRLVDYYYEQFVRAGANLSAADKAQMRDLNAQLAWVSSWAPMAVSSAPW